jgi:phosphoketolase
MPMAANFPPHGRVMEMLSEHAVEGWLEGYVLSGRHGSLNSYEPFIHVIDSMFNQHAKWLEKCNALPWPAKVSSINLLAFARRCTTGRSRARAAPMSTALTPREDSNWKWPFQ